MQLVLMGCIGLFGGRGVVRATGGSTCHFPRVWGLRG
jgi:hypothetical protein